MNNNIHKVVLQPDLNQRPTPFPVSSRKPTLLKRRNVRNHTFVNPLGGEDWQNVSPWSTTSLHPAAAKPAGAVENQQSNVDNAIIESIPEERTARVIKSKVRAKTFMTVSLKKSDLIMNHLEY